MGFCTKCGTKAKEGDIFCCECGAELRKRKTETTDNVKDYQRSTRPIQAITYTPNIQQEEVNEESDKMVFGIMCIIFNAVGVPCFMRGRTSDGILRIILMAVTFGVFGIINGINGIIWGIRILKMSEEEYQSKKNMLGKGIVGI